MRYKPTYPNQSNAGEQNKNIHMEVFIENVTILPNVPKNYTYTVHKNKKNAGGGEQGKLFILLREKWQGRLY